MQPAIPSLCALIIAACIAAPALAKLPPLSDEAKAKVGDAAAKSAWTDKVGGYQLCQAMNRTAEYYRQAVKAAGNEAPPPIDTPACADPGPYVAAAVAVKPLEAAGAHSPTTMATSPPSSNATAAEIQGQTKK